MPLQSAETNLPTVVSHKTVVKVKHVETSLKSTQDQLELDSTPNQPDELEFYF